MSSANIWEEKLKLVQHEKLTLQTAVSENKTVIHQLKSNMLALTDEHSSELKAASENISEKVRLVEDRHQRLLEDRKTLWKKKIEDVKRVSQSKEDSLKAKCRQLEDRVSSLGKESNKTMSKIINDWKIKHQTLATKHATNESENAKLKREVLDLKRRVKEKETVSKDLYLLKDKIAKQTESEQQLQTAKYGQYEKRIETLNNEVAKLQKKRTNQKVELKRNQENQAVTHQHLEQLRVKLVKYENELAGLRTFKTEATKSYEQEKCAFIYRKQVMNAKEKELVAKLKKMKNTSEGMTKANTLRSIKIMLKGHLLRTSKGMLASAFSRWNINACKLALYISQQTTQNKISALEKKSKADIIQKTKDAKAKEKELVAKLEDMARRTQEQSNAATLEQTKLEVKLHAVQQQLSEKNKVLSEARRERDGTSKAMRKSEEEVSKAYLESSKLEIKLASLQQQLSETKKALKLAKKEKDEALHVARKKSDEVSKAKVRQDALISEYGKVKTKCQDMEDELKGDREKNVSRNKEHDLLKANNSKILGEKNKLSIKFEKLRGARG